MTAAGLWLADLGLAIGIGFYSGTIVGFLFSIFALIILKKIDIYVISRGKYVHFRLWHLQIYICKRCLSASKFMRCMSTFGLQICLTASS